jgi:hypothetical protein
MAEQEPQYGKRLMTTAYEARKEPEKDFMRTKDGYLYPTGGRYYREPGEAIKTWRNGELKPGCNAEVFAMWSSSPCGNTPKHDPDHLGRPTKCGMHCKAAVEKREAKKAATTARWNAEWAARDALHEARAGLETALRKIAEGHNDPRSLAQETLDTLEAAKAASKAACAKP